MSSRIAYTEPSITALDVRYATDAAANGAWMPTVVFAAKSGVTPEMLQAAFLVESIDARAFFHPSSSLPMFTAQPCNRLACDLPTRAINLPSFHDVTSSDSDDICAAIHRLRNGR